MGVQRLLRAVYRRALHSADGTVREEELGRQLQQDRVLAAILPPEFSASHSGSPAVLAAAVAAWVFEGEEAARAVQAATGARDQDRGMTLQTFVHEMNSRHHAALVRKQDFSQAFSLGRVMSARLMCRGDALQERAAAPYDVCTEAEALAQLCADYQLPAGMSATEMVWVVEERLGLPHEQHVLPAEAAAGGAGRMTAEAVVAEALVLLFAQAGRHVVLVPEEEAQSRAVAMEGLARVIGGDDSLAGGGEQHLVDYTALDGPESPHAAELEARGLARPFGSYRRSRRAAVPDDTDLLEQLQIGLRPASAEYRGGGGLSEREEVELALTPTDADRAAHSHLPHAKKKERRRRAFDDMMSLTGQRPAESRGSSERQAAQQKGAEARKKLEALRTEGSPTSDTWVASPPVQGQRHSSSRAKDAIAAHLESIGCS